MAARAALSRHAAHASGEDDRAAQRLGLGGRRRGEEAAEERHEGAWCEDELAVLEPRRVPLKVGDLRGQEQAGLYMFSRMIGAAFGMHVQRRGGTGQGPGSRDDEQ